MLIILSGLSLLISSCSEETKKAKSTTSKEVKTEPKSSAMFEVEGKVFSIPSPIQTALLIKESGNNFNKEILNPTTNVSKYISSAKKALNLGIYGTNLGYVTIFEETQSSIAYLATSKSLASDLGIANIFNQSLLARYEKNINNKDSLLTLVSDAFRATDRYLKDNDQEDLGALILAGGWVETLYLATQTIDIESNPKIKNRIGEQKITIENLIKLLLSLNESDDINLLIADLNELKDIYNQVAYSYTFVEPVTDAENKTTTIKSTSSTKMSNETLGLISQKVYSIRNTIIQ
jgi:hypothetical protein